MHQGFTILDLCSNAEPCATRCACALHLICACTYTPPQSRGLLCILPVRKTQLTRTVPHDLLNTTGILQIQYIDVHRGDRSSLSTKYAVAAVSDKTEMNDSSDGSTVQEEGPHTPQEMVISQPSAPLSVQTYSSSSVLLTRSRAVHIRFKLNAAAIVGNDYSEELSPWEIVSMQETGYRYPEELV